MPRDGPSIAVGRTGGPDDPFQLLAIESIRDLGRELDDLTPAIARVCDRAGVKPNQIARVAVSIGPGGFTSLRMAIASAKMIALAHSCACFAVPTALAAALNQRRLPGPLGVVLATKGESAFVTVFNPEHLRASSPPTGRVVTAQALADMNIRTLICDPHAPASMLAWAKSAGVPVHPLRLSAIDTLDATGFLAPIAPVQLAPEYAREPEAVTLWRNRKQVP